MKYGRKVFLCPFDKEPCTTPNRACISQWFEGDWVSPSVTCSRFKPHIYDRMVKAQAVLAS